MIEAVRRIDLSDELYLKMMRTPALSGPERDIDRMEENLQAFLYSIFDRPLENARRRSRSTARIRFEKRARIKGILYQISPLGWWEAFSPLLKKRQ